MSLLTPQPAETADRPSTRFTWKIENFSTSNPKKLYSETFSAGGCKWRMLLFPKGNNVDSLSVYLDVPDSPTLPHQWPRSARFSLSLIDQVHGEFTVTKYTIHQFKQLHSDWGFSKFLPLSELYDPTKGYLVNDTIVVEAEVTVNWSEDSENETRSVGLENNNANQGIHREESQHPSKDNASHQDSSEATPVGNTSIIYQPDAAATDKVRFLSYWVSSEASLVLKNIHNLHQNTFTKFSMKGHALQTLLLESLAMFIESMSTTKVNVVDRETLRSAAISISDFEHVGLDLSWLKLRLDEAKRVNKLSESLTFVDLCESALKVGRAKVRELEEGLAEAKKVVEDRSKDLPKSVGVDDYLLKDVV